MRILFLFLFTLFLIKPTLSQEYKLKVYTKYGCDRCNSSLKILDKYSVIYKNCDISEEEFQTQMWVDLAKIGELKAAIVPILVLNGEIVYPVYKNGKIQKVNKELFLNNLAKSLTQKDILAETNKTNKLQIDYSNSIKGSNSQQQANGKYYVICSSFSNEQRAKVFQELLIKQGYLYAKILENNNSFRVSISNFSLYKDALIVQQKVSKKYKGAWIFIKKN